MSSAPFARAPSLTASSAPNLNADCRRHWRPHRRQGHADRLRRPRLRGSGLGGGGSAEGLGGLGTKGRGSGKSGRPGGGNFGAKGEGGIGRIGGDPIILGALDKSLIDAVIKRHMNQIRYCYQRC